MTRCLQFCKQSNKREIPHGQRYHAILPYNHHTRKHTASHTHARCVVHCGPTLLLLKSATLPNLRRGTITILLDMRNRQTYKLQCSRVVGVCNPTWHYTNAPQARLLDNVSNFLLAIHGGGVPRPLATELRICDRDLNAHITCSHNCASQLVWQDLRSRPGFTWHFGTPLCVSVGVLGNGPKVTPIFHY